MENQSGWADLKQEVERLQRRGEQPPKMKTGFQQMDEFLFGGLSPGLVVLGGRPGAGKSTFCLQMAENVAESGVQVLYFSMEMPARGLMVKSINRRMFQKGCPINAAALMGGNGENQLDEAQWEQVEQIKQSGEFRSVQKNLHIWTTPLSASEIKSEVLKLAQEDRGGETDKPLVIVDYLQIVSPEKNANLRGDKEKNDDKVRQFTQLAHESGFTVILISSLNRGSYTGPMSGAIQMGSFKETGEIEYAADLLLGLQFQNQRKNANLAKEQGKDPREVEISVLKNRYGRSGCAIPFAYYAANDCFEEQLAKEAKEASPAPALKKKEAAADRRTFWRCVINNTKVANEIREGHFGKRSCRVSKEDDPEVIVEYELFGKLSSLDCCVADAIYTVAIHLWEDGVPKADEPLSPIKLMKALSGARRPTVTRQKRNELLDSIERLQRIQFSLNCEEELKAREIDGIGPEKLREYHGPFLNLEVKEQSGGEWGGTVISFKKGVCPLFLHTYGAEVNHQMITIPSVLLDVPKGKRTMSNTAENICLKRLLVQRMEVARCNEKKGYLRTIAFQEEKELLRRLRPIEFWEAKAKGGDRVEPTKGVRVQKLDRLYKFAEEILEYYKRIQYISDYKAPQKNENIKFPSFEVVGRIKDPMQLPKMK